VYALALTSAAQRDLKRLPNVVSKRVDEAILSLRQDCRQNGCIKLGGESHLYRMLVGDYRVIYAIDDPKELVTIARIRHRRDAYENL
jgi:mRNA interferase RelE/StbE